MEKEIYTQSNNNNKEQPDKSQLEQFIVQEFNSWNQKSPQVPYYSKLSEDQIRRAKEISSQIEDTELKNFIYASLFQFFSSLNIEMTKDNLARAYRDECFYRFQNIDRDLFNLIIAASEEKEREIVQPLEEITERIEEEFLKKTDGKGNNFLQYLIFLKRKEILKIIFEAMTAKFDSEDPDKSVDWLIMCQIDQMGETDKHQHVKCRLLNKLQHKEKNNYLLLMAQYGFGALNLLSDVEKESLFLNKNNEFYFTAARFGHFEEAISLIPLDNSHILDKEKNSLGHILALGREVEACINFFTNNPSLISWGNGKNTAMEIAYNNGQINLTQFLLRYELFNLQQMKHKELVSDLEAHQGRDLVILEDLKMKLEQRMEGDRNKLAWAASQGFEIEVKFAIKVLVLATEIGLERNGTLICAHVIPSALKNGHKKLASDLLSDPQTSSIFSPATVSLSELRPLRKEDNDLIGLLLDKGAKPISEDLDAAFSEKNWRLMSMLLKFYAVPNYNLIHVLKKEEQGEWLSKAVRVRNLFLLDFEWFTNDFLIKIKLISHDTFHQNLEKKFKSLIERYKVNEKTLEIKKQFLADLEKIFLRLVSIYAYSLSETFFKEALSLIHSSLDPLRAGSEEYFYGLLENTERNPKFDPESAFHPSFLQFLQALTGENEDKNSEKRIKSKNNSMEEGKKPLIKDKANLEIVEQIEQNEYFKILNKYPKFKEFLFLNLERAGEHFFFVGTECILAYLKLMDTSNKELFADLQKLLTQYFLPNIGEKIKDIRTLTLDDLQMTGGNSASRYLNFLNQIKNQPQIKIFKDSVIQEVDNFNRRDEIRLEKEEMARKEREQYLKDYELERSQQIPSSISEKELKQMMMDWFNVHEVDEHALTFFSMEKKDIDISSKNQFFNLLKFIFFCLRKNNDLPDERFIDVKLLVLKVILPNIEGTELKPFAAELQNKNKNPITEKMFNAILSARPSLKSEIELELEDDGRYVPPGRSSIV